MSYYSSFSSLSLSSPSHHHAHSHMHHSGPEHTDPRTSTEIIKDKLYFCVLSRAPVPNSSSHFFTIDDLLRYEPFFEDFGPLNLSCTYRFCKMLEEKLKNPEYANKTIYYWCSSRPQQKSNAAVLIGIYQMLHLQRTPQQAYEPLKKLEPFMNFRDAAQEPCTFKLTVFHCLKGVAKAQKCHFFDFSNFSADEYEHFEQVENGDLNILVPGKFLAFSGPHSTNVSPAGYPALTPADYVPIFKMYNVKTVVRLNKKMYDRNDFIKAGIQHHDLYFLDGSTPAAPLLDKFLQICESVNGTIAVHCKAGLGRTGTTIGAYIIKHYGFTAAEVIAWMRICRPGCVIGQQQQYLKMIEQKLLKSKPVKTVTSPTAAAPSPLSLNSPSSTNSNSSPTNHTPPAAALSSVGRSPYSQYVPSPAFSRLSSGSSSPATPGSYNLYSQSFDGYPTTPYNGLQARAKSVLGNNVRGRTKAKTPTSDTKPMRAPRASSIGSMRVGSSPGTRPQAKTPTNSMVQASSIYNTYLSQQQQNIYNGYTGTYASSNGSSKVRASSSNPLRRFKK